MQTQLEASRPSSSIKINQQEVRGHSFISTLYLAQYFAHCVPNTYIYTYIHTYNAHVCIYSIRMNKYVFMCVGMYMAGRTRRRWPWGADWKRKEEKQAHRNQHFHFASSSSYFPLLVLLNIKTLYSETLLQAMIYTHKYLVICFKIVVPLMFGFYKAITYTDIHCKNV